MLDNLTPPAMDLPHGYAFGDIRTQVLSAAGLIGHVVTRSNAPAVTDSGPRGFLAMPLPFFSRAAVAVDGTAVSNVGGYLSGGPGWTGHSYATAEAAAFVLHAYAAEHGVTDPVVMRQYLGTDGEYHGMPRAIQS